MSKIKGKERYGLTKALTQHALLADGECLTISIKADASRRKARMDERRHERASASTNIDRHPYAPVAQQAN